MLAGRSEYKVGLADTRFLSGEKLERTPNLSYRVTELFRASLNFNC